ncbi:MAG: hypothetical protein KDK70_07555 [Myxococcales bacterium]|nr:hypothetical protein [Myxococcales bacterium]
MAITEELVRLGNSARRLNRGSDQLNHLIERIDELLSELNVGLDYIHPRPIDESTSVDHNGKRVIELSYVGYLRTQRNYHLAIKTVKVLESKLSLATQTPGDVVALLAAPRRLRYAAVDVLPEVVSGLAAQVDEMVGSLERRCATAESLVRNLEQIQRSAALNAEDSATRGRTLVPGDVMSPSASGHGSESGQWIMPGQSGSAPVAQPAAPRDERRTIAMGSDLLKEQGGGG